MRFGGGKTLRDGLAQASGVTNNGALTTLITNAVILDPILGILKADIGIKDGKIAGIGKAGNPYDGQGQSQDGCISLCEAPQENIPSILLATSIRTYT